MKDENIEAIIAANRTGWLSGLAKFLNKTRQSPDDAEGIMAWVKSREIGYTETDKAFAIAEEKFGKRETSAIAKEMYIRRVFSCCPDCMAEYRTNGFSD